jgi:hypothetical protein
MLKPYRIGMMLLCCLLVAISNTSIAQSDVQSIDDVVDQQDQTTHYYSTPTVPPGGGSDNVDANPPELGGGDPGAPIDGGLSVLLAAGAAYGVKRMRKKKDDGQKSMDDSEDGK